MSVIGPPKITELGKGEEFTRITFRPDLSKFQMNHLNADIIGLLKRRVYDMCATVKGVSVFLNDNKLKLNNFKDYIHMYLKSTPGPDGEDLTKRLVFERVSERWEVGFIPSSSGQLQQVSFVNSISTSKGGTHVNYVVDSIVKLIQEALDKKKLKSKVLPGAIKSNMWIFVNCLIDNPSFDSQTKENMTLKPASFGSRCELTEKFQAGVLKSGIIDMLAALSQAKDNMAMVKALDSTKSGRLSGIPKLEDANKAGTRESHKCTLILTEGDSAKALVMAGLTKVGRDYYGVFPLRGKLLNVRDASPAQIKGNKELINICKIIGLNSKVDNSDTSKLRYGHLMIMTDQDHDGSHIKGLLINFFDYFYPSLLTVDNFMQEFITPIVKAIPKSQQHEVIQFFTIPEYEQWRDNLANNPSAYNVKYYKGLATSDRREGIEYFSNLTRHMIRFEPMQDGERQLIDLAFNKKKADARKEWLRRFRPGTYIDQSGESITYSDFINKELIHFSMADNVRSIPSVVDGLKPGQRKVVYGCFLRPDAEVKVATLTGSITEKVAYHHGDQSLASTIIGLAQDFVGANNVNLLAPIGQFGSRTQGGKDAGAARYISTRLKPITRLLFHKDDMPLLNYLDDDGIKVEPEFFVPVMPIILLNGCDGIGTGWSTNIPSHNPADVASNLQRLMQGESPIPMLPWYLGFTGDIEPSGPNRYTVRGRITKIDDRHFEITELPIGMWTQAYDALLEDWRLNSDMIEDFEKHHTDLSVRYIVRVSEASMAKLEREDLYAKFKLVDTISTSNLVCFNKSGHIKRYASAEEILTEFYHIRLEFYHKRKEYLVSKLMHEYTKLSNQARFLLAVISGELEMRNVAYADFIKRLTEMGFDPINTKDDDGATNSGFDYLFNMKMINMTQELAEKLIRARDVKLEEIEVLRAKSPLDLWNTDLDLFLKLWEETVDEIQLAFAQSLTEGTSCSNKKGRKVTSKLKLKKESKETKPKGLARSDSASKPAAMKPELPSHAKAEPGSPPPSKPLSRSNSSSKPKSKLIHDGSDDSDDPFKGSLSQRTGKNLPSAVKPTPKPMAKALALDKPESKPKAAPKRKDPKVSDSEEDFEMDAALPTIAKSRPRRQAIPKASY
ncbi:DNA topoisomerase 2, partial [Massospora cicadina]